MYWVSGSQLMKTLRGALNFGMVMAPQKHCSSICPTISSKCQSSGQVIVTSILKLIWMRSPPIWDWTSQKMGRVTALRGKWCDPNSFIKMFFFYDLTLSRKLLARQFDRWYRSKFHSYPIKAIASLSYREFVSSSLSLTIIFSVGDRSVHCGKWLGRDP